MQTVAGSAPASRQAAARTALLHCGEQPPGHTFTADWVTQQQQARSFHAVSSVVGINPFSLMSFLTNFSPIFKNTLQKDFKKPLAWLEKPRSQTPLHAADE